MPLLLVGEVRSIFIFFKNNDLVLTCFAQRVVKAKVLGLLQHDCSIASPTEWEVAINLVTDHELMLSLKASMHSAARSHEGCALHFKAAVGVYDMLGE